MKRLLDTFPVFFFALFVAGAVHAQWTTESFQLKAGWNAVYLHVDASHENLNTLVGADESNAIEEIWLWMPAVGPLQFFGDPQQPSSGSSQWLRWDRYWGGSSPLQRLAPNAAYLVRVRDDVPAYTWNLKGKPVPPEFAWTTTGLNFIGFSTPKHNPPAWGAFLGPARDFHDQAEIYRYTGGPFGSGNPERLVPSIFRTERVTRGQAYWVRAEEYNRYFGPFEVVLQTSAGIRFGETSGQYRIRLRNRIGEPVTVSAHLLDSETPPPGEEPITGGVPLLRRGEMDLSDLTHGFARFSEEPGEWTLAPRGEPGSEIEIVLGLDRSAMTGNPGDVFAGLLRISDTGGLTAIDLPVSARIASADGLWIGNAVVNEVAHYLVEYATETVTEGEGEGEGEGETETRLAQNPDGSYVIERIDESFGAVARPFPLRLVVHNGASGARLLQRVYHGADNEGEIVLSLREEALDPVSLDEARRISVAHLPWSDGNVSWLFDGALGEGAEIAVSVPLDYDDQATNPFLHTYHPDHDNLDARFENELPQGVESYGITRQITLRMQPSGEDFSSVTAGSGTLSGIYEETVTVRGIGGHEQEYRARGGFALNRVSDIGTLIE